MLDHVAACRRACAVDGDSQRRADPEVTDAVRAGEPIGDARLQALNLFTTSMVATRGRPPEEELEAFLAVGYTENQVLEIILAIAVKTLSNYSNHVLDTPLDKAFARRAWTADAE